MASHNPLSTRFIKHIVRSNVETPAIRTVLATTAQNTTSSITRTKTIARAGSGLNPLTVVAVVGGLAALFVAFLLIGLVCKLANRPRSEARHQIYSKSMFQPSAAGYGSRRTRFDDPIQPLTSSNVHLLSSASPMGAGGRYPDGDVSIGSSNDADHNNRTHTRGKSSGVNFPGPLPPNSFRRTGGGQQHPQLHSENMFESVSRPFSSAAPDGSGFVPGQIFDHTNMAPSSRKAGAATVRRNPSLKQKRSINRGPPPALSRTRSGRYAQGQDLLRRSRIDSVGPGTYRKSMFMADADAHLTPKLPSGAQLKTIPSADDTTSSWLKRVDSVGKGDARRSSKFIGSRNTMMRTTKNDRDEANYANASQNTYKDRDGQLAHTDRQASGKRTPILASSVNPTGSVTNGPLGPLGPSRYASPNPFASPADPTLAYNSNSPSFHPMSTGYNGPGPFGTSGGGMYGSSRLQTVEGVGSGGRQIL